MPLLKNQRIIADTWRHIDDTTSLPTGGGVVVSLARWQSEREILRGRNAPLGIRLRSDEGAGAIADDLAYFDLVALEFPQFKDGRAYSTARLLRQRYGYTGELRAIGEVLYDQLQFMRRCGFDAFEYAGKMAAEEALAAFGEIDVVYQTAADQRRSAALIRNDTSNVFLNGTCG